MFDSGIVLSSQPWNNDTNGNLSRHDFIDDDDDDDDDDNDDDMIFFNRNVGE